jgi:uncharacterized membrane protein
MTEAPQALLNDPMSVFAFLASLVAAIFWLSGVPRLKKTFTYLPPVLFVYFLPMISTTLGITPPASAAYDFTTRYFLPVALFLLMISVDLKSVAKLGPMALVMMAAGTVGIILGGPLALALFGHWLPSDAWQGFAALSGSWIGGTANMVAIAESVGTPPSAFNPVIVVDTVVGYGWMGVLLFFSVWQTRFDTWSNARTKAIEETNARLAEMERERHPTTVRDMAFLLGMGVGAAVMAVKLGATLPTLGNPTIISGTTWAVLMVVTAGLLLSFTPLREYEKVGASQFGYTALYLLLAGIGAQADVRAVLQAPLYLAAGAVWIATHVVVLYAAARIVKAPLFFIATGSMANIGGPVSAPVVAGVYHPAMAPVGLLMAVVGYVFGVYGALLCAYLLGQVATLMGFV